MPVWWKIIDFANENTKLPPWIQEELGRTAVLPTSSYPPVRRHYAQLFREMIV